MSMIESLALFGLLILLSVGMIFLVLYLDIQFVSYLKLNIDDTIPVYMVLGIFEVLGFMFAGSIVSYLVEE